MHEALLQLDLQQVDRKSALDSIWDSVQTSIENTVWNSVRVPDEDSVGNFVSYVVCGSVRYFVRRFTEEKLK